MFSYSLTIRETLWSSAAALFLNLSLFDTVCTEAEDLLRRELSMMEISDQAGLMLSGG
jgi:hypothetical protein